MRVIGGELGALGPGPSAVLSLGEGRSAPGEFGLPNADSARESSGGAVDRLRLGKGPV